MGKVPQTKNMALEQGATAGASPAMGGLGASGPGFGAPASPQIVVSPADKYGKRPLAPSAPKLGAGAASGGGGLTAGLNEPNLRSSNLKWLGDGGWQPGKFKKAIPDELLSNRAPFLSKGLAEAAKKEANANSINGIPLANTNNVVRRGANSPQGEAKAAADGKSEKSDEQYRKDVDKAREYAEKRAEELQKQLSDSLARQRNQMKEKVEQERQLQADRALPGAAAPPAAPNEPVLGARPNQGYVVPAEDRAMDRVRAAVPTAKPLVVREYAAPRPGREAGDKIGDSFEADTILWQPILVLPSSGKMVLDVQLGTSLGGYEVIIAGHTLDGRIGAVRGIIPIANNVPAATTQTVPPGGIVTPNKP